MKKLLVILPCLLLCLIMVAVPVSAASSDLEVSVTDGTMESNQEANLLSGYYKITFVDLYEGSSYVVPSVFIPEGNFDYVTYEIPNLIYEDYPVFLCVERDDDLMIDLKYSDWAMTSFSGTLVFTPTSPPPSPAGVFDVFGALGVWVVGALGWLTGIFWTGSSLTLLGVLAVCALAFAVIFLIIRIIQRFLHFRG